MLRDEIIFKEYLKSRYQYSKYSGEVLDMVKGRFCVSVDSAGYKYVTVQWGGKYTSLKAHRLAWLLETGDWPEGIIDHKNGDRTDNRIENLRVATQGQNLRNRPTPVNNSSGYKGVHFRSNKNCFVSQIRKNGVGRVREGFTCRKEAALQYNLWAEELFGEFAYYNAVFLDVEKETLDKEL